MVSLYQQIEQALRHHSSSIDVSKSMSDEAVYQAIRQVMRDNPDIFWFSHQWHYSKEDAKIQFHYTIDGERSAKIQAQIEDVIANDFNVAFVRTLPIAERVMYVYKWIALYCNYSVRSAHNQTIYSVFLLRSSVCTGIAKAAQYLLQESGIESRLVFGKMNNSDEDSRHCWLIVNVEGCWYHLDPTFAMPETRKLLIDSGVEPITGIGEDPILYNYFCVDTDTIKQSRTIEEENLLPDCPARIDYKLYQAINVTVSRNGDKGGLGCLLSDSGTTADIYIAHSKDKYYRLRSVAKVYRNDPDHELLRKEQIVMRECVGEHLIRATAADFNNGILYMEQATPLAELLASHYYKLTVREFCYLLMDIAQSWLELYGCGIIYRDLHLNNIYLSDTQIKGRYIYKLGDFGSCTFVSKNGRYNGLTQQGGVGSKWYMAPETWRNGTFDERSAVYGVGMIAYYLLNDLCPPFWKEMKDISFDTRMNGAAFPQPSVLREKEFEHLQIPFILRSLEYNSADRYVTLASMMTDIERFLRQYQSLENVIIIKGSQFGQEQRKNQEKFCSTCMDNPSIEVSNGEPCRISDSASKINDFASTCDVASIQDRLCIVHESTLEKDDNKRPDSWEPLCSRCCMGAAAGALVGGKAGALVGGKAGALVGGKAGALVGGKVGALVGSIGGLFDLMQVNDNRRLTQDSNQLAYGSVFAPSEVKRKQHMMVQVYLHLSEETEKVMSLAMEADRNAERRGYEPLEVKLKKGNEVIIELNINGDTLLYNDRKSVVWHGSFVKRAFDYIVPDDIDVNELSCSVNIFVNGAIAGEMMFLTDIVDYNPRRLNTEIIAKPTKKLFISYSHKDIKSAERIAKIHEALGIDVFFDKHRLKAGYIYSEEISKFIQTADTFVLCWSKNASESDYVEKERQEALSLAYPQRKPRERARLRIHPYNIEPHAVPPADMIENYHFEEL